MSFIQLQDGTWAYVINYSQRSGSREAEAISLTSFREWPEDCRLWIEEEMVQDPPDWMHTIK